MNTLSKYDRIPRKHYIFSASMICIAAIISFLIVTHNNPSFNLHVKAMFAVLGAGFLVLVSFVCQFTIIKILKRCPTKQTLEMGILLLPALTLSSLTIYSLLPSVRVSNALSTMGLASLPKSAHDSNIFKWSNLFAGETYMMFRTDREGIDKFVAESSLVLESAICQTYNEERMCLYWPDDFKENMDKYHDDNYEPLHEYIQPPSSVAPKWYDGEIRDGKLYGIPRKFPNSYTLIINFEKNAVYCKFIKS